MGQREYTCACVPTWPPYTKANPAAYKSLKTYACRTHLALAGVDAGQRLLVQHAHALPLALEGDGRLHAYVWSCVVVIDGQKGGGGGDVWSQDPMLHTCLGVVGMLQGGEQLDARQQLRLDALHAVLLVYMIEPGRCA